MAESPSKLRVCQHPQGIVFQLADKATLQQAPALRVAAERAIVAGTGYVHVDLRHCTYMDSTFIGTLLFLNKAVERHGLGGFAVVSPSSACRTLLEKMGLQPYCPAIEGAELPQSSWTELSTDANDSTTFKTCVVRAHQELAGVPGPTGAAFRGVAQALTKEQDADQTRDGH